MLAGAALKASGADTFVIFALPKQAIQAFVAAAKLGWKPSEYVTSVSIDPAVMQIVHLNAGPQTGVGATSTAFLHDPTNPTQKSSAGVKLYLQIMKRYLPNEDPKAVAHIYGMMAAYAMVDALKDAGKNPTRASLLNAAQHLNDRRTRSCCRASSSRPRRRTTSRSARPISSATSTASGTSSASRSQTS